MSKIDFRNGNLSIDDLINDATDKRNSTIAEATEKATVKAISKICKALIFQATRDHEIYDMLSEKFKTAQKTASEVQQLCVFNYDYKPYSRTRHVKFDDDYVEAAMFLAACNIFVESGEEIHLSIYKGNISVSFDENTFAEQHPDIVEHLDNLRTKKT